MGSGTIEILLVKLHLSAETYSLIDHFKKVYYSSSHYLQYKKRMIEMNPETRLAF